MFTHSLDDLHYEHKFVANEVLLVCRRMKDSTVKALYTSSSPTLMQSFQRECMFTPNYFVDISEYAEKKKEALSRYSMELPSDNNDIRSAESILT